MQPLGTLRLHNYSANRPPREKAHMIYYHPKLLQTPVHEDRGGHDLYADAKSDDKLTRENLEPSLEAALPAASNEMPHLQP